MLGAMTMGMNHSNFKSSSIATAMDQNLTLCQLRQDVGIAHGIKIFVDGHRRENVNDKSVAVASRAATATFANGSTHGCTKGQLKKQQLQQQQSLGKTK